MKSTLDVKQQKKALLRLDSAPEMQKGLVNFSIEFVIVPAKILETKDDLRRRWACGPANYYY